MQVPQPVNPISYAPPPPSDVRRVEPEERRDDEERRERRRRSRRRSERSGGRRASDAPAAQGPGGPDDRHGTRLTSAEVASFQVRLAARHVVPRVPVPSGPQLPYEVVDVSDGASVDVTDAAVAAPVDDARR